MNENLNNLLQLRNKIKSLEDNVLALEKEKEKLRGEIVDLQEKNTFLQKENLNWKMASGLCLSEDDKKKNIRRLTNMINQITDIEKLLND